MRRPGFDVFRRRNSRRNRGRDQRDVYTRQRAERIEPDALPQRPVYDSRIRLHADRIFADVHAVRTASAAGRHSDGILPDDPAAGNIGALQGGSGQAHGAAMAQVLCSANGQSTGLAALSPLGACDIPAGALKPGDRIEVRFNFAHTGAVSGFGMEVDWGDHEGSGAQRRGAGCRRRGTDGIRHLRGGRANYRAKLGNRPELSAWNRGIARSAGRQRRLQGLRFHSGIGYSRPRELHRASLSGVLKPNPAGRMGAFRAPLSGKGRARGCSPARARERERRNSRAPVLNEPPRDETGMLRPPS